MRIWDNIKRVKALFVIASVFVAALFLYLRQASVPMANISYVTIGENVFQAEIANDDAERSRGLSGRASLGRDKAMLFIFRSKKNYLFWMKDMNFPLDIIWIDGDKIVDISENVPVPKSLSVIPRISPMKPVDKVLEIEAGEAKRRGIAIGDTVLYTKITGEGD